MANWLSGYTTRKKITIDKSKIDSDLTDFPVLVKLTSSNFDFSKANSDGFDLRFTSSDGTTLLKYERERHDATNKLAEYWVKIPSISSTANTIFYLYYRVEDTADGADPTNVWDSNFKGVWHMKDLTTSTIEDSTSNNNDGTKKASNEPIQADRQIAKAQGFDGSDDYIDCGNDASLNITDEITIEAWIYPKNLVGEKTILRKEGQIAFNIIPNDLCLWLRKSGSWTNVVSTGGFSSGDINKWYHIVATWDGNYPKLYVNGELEATGSQYIGPLDSSSYKDYIGVLTDESNWRYFFNGSIDEVRISSVARSADWIKATYYSLNNSLLTYGAEETNANFFPFF